MGVENEPSSASDDPGILPSPGESQGGELETQGLLKGQEPLGQGEKDHGLSIVDRLEQLLAPELFFREIADATVKDKRETRDLLRKALNFCETLIGPEIDLLYDPMVFGTSYSPHALALARRGITTLAQLELAIAENRLADMPGVRRRLPRIREWLKRYHEMPSRTAEATSSFETPEAKSD